MNDSARRFGTLVALAAIVWHALAVLTPAWVNTFDQHQARDFASYYYAVEVANQGGDPYAKGQLNNAARLQGLRTGVHPFLYAPPFLLGMAWVAGFDLPSAFHLWFWLHELTAVAAAIVLWRWWRPLSPSVGWVIAVVFGCMTAIPNNHMMGQANFPGLALALGGLWATESGRPRLGGALMGAACMLKMSPALFVVWWMVRREWVAVAASIVSGAVLSVAALPFAGPMVQWRFYTEILPSFSSGNYNGLAVPVGMFGNHSVPNLLDQLWPGTSAGLSRLARFGSSTFALASLAGLGWAFFTRPGDREPDGFARAGQAAVYGVLLLLIPVYTYEHHLVFALPAAVLAALGIETGRLGPRWVVPTALSIAVLLFDLQVLKSESNALSGWWAPLGGLLQEAKFLSLLGLGLASARIGVSAGEGLSPAGERA
ncbi:MAG: glycosyltransferase family 87 protein [Myxococcota bacterium]